MSGTNTEGDAPRRPRTRDEFLSEFLWLGRCIDNVLVAHHGLRHALAPDHLPFNAEITKAMERYGPGSPIFHLWNECRVVEELRVAWTGKPSPPREHNVADPIGVAVPVPEVAPVPEPVTEPGHGPTDKLDP